MAGRALFTGGNHEVCSSVPNTQSQNLDVTPETENDEHMISHK